MAAKPQASKPKKLPVATAAPTKPRRLKKPAYASFHLQKRVKHIAPPLMSGGRLFRNCAGLLIRNWKLIGGIVLVFGLAQLVLVQGFGNASNITEIKKSAELVTEGNIGQMGASVTSFAYLLGTTGVGGAYQSFAILITSLALIWTIRQLYAGETPRIRDGFYKGIYPLVQFVLVLCVVALQTLPVIAATALFSFAVSNGIVVHGIEYALWFLLLFGTLLLTLYMLCSSLFALYIVTLPDMTPMRALRAARELVRFRRWTVMRRIIFLPIALVLLVGIIMIPIIIVAAAAAGYIFVFLSLFGIAIIHSYMYRLYKELLG